MRKALSRRAAISARAACLAIVLAFGAAGTAPAQVKTLDWGTSDGGAVVVRASGAFDLAVTDAQDGSSIFSAGQVTSRKTLPDGKTEITLKPTGSSGKADSYVILVNPDGSGELWVVTGGSRHKAADLTK